MCSNTLLYVTSHRHNESNRIFLAFASIRSKFTVFDSLCSICMKLRYETNFLHESSNLPSPRFPSPRFVNIREYSRIIIFGSHVCWQEIYFPLSSLTSYVLQTYLNSKVN